MLPLFLGLIHIPRVMWTCASNIIGAGQSWYTNVPLSWRGLLEAQTPPRDAVDTTMALLHCHVENYDGLGSNLRKFFTFSWAASWLSTYWITISSKNSSIVMCMSVLITVTLFADQSLKGISRTFLIPVITLLYRSSFLSFIERYIIVCLLDVSE